MRAEIQLITAVILILVSTSSSSPVIAATNVKAFTSNNSTIAKMGCADRCGNVSIPFPFGTTPDCYLNDDFFINCNGSVPFLRHSNIDITSISLIHGHLTVMQYIAHHCYDRNRTRTKNNAPQITLSQTSQLTVSSTANNFVVVGCDTTGSVSGRRFDDRLFKTGCTTTCSGKDDVENGTCTGLGCCQTSIPKNVSWVDVSLRSDHKYRDVWNFSGCGYAFVVEKTAFTFYPQNISSLRQVENLPMVLDWTIGKRSCGEAMANSSAYACRGVNSICYDADNGYGYRCNCTPGYQGNPYLDGGCQGTFS